ncbi:LytR C-terminal domain-containing protein [Streptomyces oceani]|uniref:LytR/CpsA/Psr regulator C-terminal domain-containing protein n=1 Tax=Streptomyces oceani TaxID=1075402 RepID=A0A1E7JWF2_9ACTN|nr:LytR C-terminal domain-containing protein [Streptomyces oceani]OEU95982.1 hypothetical protein AN216_22920 [Streptomyces oceani]
MSMLTPPGMGGQYRIKGDRYPRMRPPRNRRRFVFASAGTVITLSLISWGTFQLIDVFSANGGGSAQAAGQHDGKCATTDGKGNSGTAGAAAGQGAADASAAQRGGLPKPDEITVNVLNATKRSGLAADTADKLEKRGFTIGDVANAPASLDQQVKKPGLLIGATGKQIKGSFQVLGSHLEGEDTRRDNRDDEDVDLVIGDGFDGLTTKRDAERAVAALTEPDQPSPRPSRSC